MGPDAPREDMHRMNDRLFLSALPHARALGINIATETFGDSSKHGCCDFFGNIDEFIEAYDRIANDYGYGDCFRVCMDTGHTNKAMRFNNNPKPEDAIRMLGSRINTLHLHDNDTMTDQHKIPMTGCIDWHAVLSALDDIGYSGVYMLEVALVHFGTDFEIEEAAFAVKVMRQMLREHDRLLESK
jgi:sugar phosphate isomerase/epimerase